MDYGLSALADAGYRRVCLVIGPDHGVLRRYYTEEVECRRLQLSFAVQAQPRGTADAVAAAADFVGDDPFVALNSDNIYPTQALSLMRTLAGPGLAVFDRESLLENSNIPADRVRRFALVQTDGEGYLQRIMEKPKREEVADLPHPLGVSMNCWRFDRRIFTACGAISPSARGELEIPDAVAYAAGRLGVRFQGADLPWAGIGSVEPGGCGFSGALFGRSGGGCCE